MASSSHHLTSLHQTKPSNHKDETKNINTLQAASRTKQINQDQKKSQQTDYITTFKLGKDSSRASTSNSSKRLREDRKTQLSTNRHDHDDKLTPDGSLVMQEPTFLPPIK